ncbi:Nramp family divalent metal transporter [Saccharopolyspora sp. NPDC050642]|uniref:Nramp family divalent metal transporter n=1 Tax=Saccharopolyspora sp. NPDC050642 TaxID=3157099 RepID=UPI0034043A1B
MAGWATGGTTTLAFAFGFAEDAVPYVTIGVLLLIGVVLTVSPVVYRTVEKIQFFLIGLIVLFLIYAALVLLGLDGWLAIGKGFGIGSEAEDFEFIRLVGDRLSGATGTIFFLIGAVVLYSTNLAVLDMVGRVTADMLKTGSLRNSCALSESRIYFIVVWAEIVFGSAILLCGLDEPLILLIIASSLNGIVMFVYAVLLIKLNRGVLRGRSASRASDSSRCVRPCCSTEDSRCSRSTTSSASCSAEQLGEKRSRTGMGVAAAGQTANVRGVGALPGWELLAHSTPRLTTEHGRAYESSKP